MILFKEEFKMYNNLINEFKFNPRDIHTVPLKSKSHKWFYVYVEIAHNNTPKM